jgi:hypothetical protein
MTETDKIFAKIGEKTIRYLKFTKGFKTLQCYNANNWGLCLAGSTYWHNRFPACKQAPRHYSKTKEELDGSTKYIFL